MSDNPNIDPAYRESDRRGNPQSQEVPIRRAPQGPKSRPVGKTGTPLGEERNHAVKRWKPKGRK